MTVNSEIRLGKCSRRLGNEIDPFFMTVCVNSGSDFTQVLTRNEVVPLRDAWVVCYIIGYCLLLLSNGGIYLGNFYSSDGRLYQQKQLATCSAMAESDSSNDSDVNLLKESGVRTRGTRSRKCPGCHLSHQDQHRISLKVKSTNHV